MCYRRINKDSTNSRILHLMLYREYPASLTLSPYIRYYAELDYFPSQKTAISEIVSPMLGRGIVFRIQGCENDLLHTQLPHEPARQLKMGYILPLWTEGYQVTYQYPFKMVAVLFQPGKFRHLFDLPMPELVNRIYSFEELGLQELSDLHDQLWETPTTPQRLALLEHFFFQKLKKRQPRFDFTDFFLEQLPENLLLDQFQLHTFASQNLFKSPKQVRRIIRQQLGINPKKYESILRFNKSMEILKQNPHLSLSQIALQSGFTDISHLGRQFKKYIGSSPTDFQQSLHPFLDRTRFRK